MEDDPFDNGTASDKHPTSEIMARNSKYMPIKSECRSLLESFLTFIHILVIYFCVEKVGWYFSPCSEGIVANLGYLQSRRKTGIIHETYVKAYFIQPTICMRFFYRFIREFYPGDACLGQTVPKRSGIFQLKSLKKFILFCISIIISFQDQLFNLLFVVG